MRRPSAFVERAALDAVVLLELLVVDRHRRHQRAVVGALLDQHRAAVRQVADHFVLVADDLAAAAVERHQPLGDLALLDAMDDPHRLRCASCARADSGHRSCGWRATRTCAPATRARPGRPRCAELIAVSATAARATEYLRTAIEALLRLRPAATALRRRLRVARPSVATSGSPSSSASTPVSTERRRERRGIFAVRDDVVRQARGRHERRLAMVVVGTM